MTALGHWVNWSIQVKNTGNVNLTGVVVNDPLTGESWNVGTLLIGESQVPDRPLPGNQGQPVERHLHALQHSVCGWILQDRQGLRR